MGAVDPAYPLYPIACIVASVLLLLVLTSSFVRQSWNLGVAFLCFWLFFENLTFAANAVIWSDNDDVKLYVYCDIVSHLQIVTTVVKPMSSFLIMRRLHSIASLRCVQSSDGKKRRIDRLIEWTLGFVIPALVAGPMYYVAQQRRFVVIEGIGCVNSTTDDGILFLLLYPWTIAPPLLSAIIYYPRIVWILHRRHTELDQFLHSNNSISRSCYFRVLTLASVDIVFTLFVNITDFVIHMLSYDQFAPFYPGWNYVHTDWAPVSFTWEELRGNRWADIYTQWTAPLFAFVIFGLFGLTEGARASYRHALSTMKGWFMRVLVGGRDGCKSAISVLRSIRCIRPKRARSAESLVSTTYSGPETVIDIAPPSLDVEGKDHRDDDLTNAHDSQDPSRPSNETEDTKTEPLDMNTVDVGGMTIRSAADLA
ncbi:unnamed protein product [Peniophora sp. CBMAI 1063]|nr:unnamed protein product [Peniophora sp. CBMAI 1063]